MTIPIKTTNICFYIQKHIKKNQSLQMVIMLSFMWAATTVIRMHPEKTQLMYKGLPDIKYIKGAFCLMYTGIDIARIFSFYLLPCALSVWVIERVDIFFEKQFNMKKTYTQFIHSIVVLLCLGNILFFFYESSPSKKIRSKYFKSHKETKKTSIKKKKQPAIKTKKYDFI